MKKIVALAALAALFFTACENDTADTQSAAKVDLHAKEMLIQYLNSSKTAKTDFSTATKVLNVTYSDREDPSMDGKKSFVLYFQERGLPPAFGTETPGWFYNDRTQCLIYGTWVTWPSGISIFYPASYATQVLMNDCESAKNVA